jgi:hypothetical protein
MSVESDDDLAGFFDPDEFGVELVGHHAGGQVSFFGILTSGYVGEPTSGKNGAPRTVITDIVPRIIARQAAVSVLRQNDEIELPDSSRVVINDMQVKGAMVAIHYHVMW